MLESPTDSIAGNEAPRSQFLERDGMAVPRWGASCSSDAGVDVWEVARVHRAIAATTTTERNYCPIDRARWKGIGTADDHGPITNGEFIFGRWYDLLNVFWR